MNRPVMLADDVPGEVLVFAHESREAAEASAAANHDEYGYPCEVESRQVWVTVVDLRPVIAAIRRD